MKKLSFLTLINRGVRSFLFSLFVIVITIPYSFLCLAAYTLPLRYRCALIAFWTGCIIKALRLLCGVNWQTEGTEHIPQHSNGILFSKHQSTWETFFIQNQFPNAAIILKRELFWVPFFGWGLATTQPIAINRSNTSTAMQQIIAQGKKCLAAGRWILVFPEGTRTTPGTAGHYKLGGARLATETGYPILPIAHNAGRYWPKRGFLKNPGTIRVVYGPLIETKGRRPDEVLAEAKKWIEETTQRIGG